MSRALALLTLVALGALAPAVLLGAERAFPRLTPVLDGSAYWLIACFLAAAGAGAWLARPRCDRADRPIAEFARSSLTSVAVVALILLAVNRVEPQLAALLADSQPWHVALLVRLGAATAVSLPGLLYGLAVPLAVHGCVRSPTHLAVTVTVLYAAGLGGVALGCYAARAGLLDAGLPRLLGLLGLAAPLSLVTWLVASRDPVTLFGGSTAGDLAARGFSRFILPPRLVRRLAFLLGFIVMAALATLLELFPQHGPGVWYFAALGLLAAALSGNVLVRVDRGFLAILLMLLVIGALWAGLGFRSSWIGAEDFGETAFLTSWCLGLGFPFLIRLVEPFSRSAGPAVAALLVSHALGAATGMLLYPALVLDVLRPEAAMNALAVLGALAGLLTLRFMTARRILYAGIGLAALCVTAWRFVESYST